jgi:hypothetical protein
MQESKLPDTAEDAIKRVLTAENGFAFIGLNYVYLHIIKLKFR